MGPQDRVADKGVMPKINPGAQPCEIGTDGQPIRQPARSRKPQVGGLGRLCQRVSAFRLAAKKPPAFTEPSEPRLDAVTLAELERAIDSLELMDDAPGGPRA